MTSTWGETLGSYHFFLGGGAVGLWSLIANFFWSPPWHAPKNFGPPLCLSKRSPSLEKNSAPPLCDPQKILVPTLTHWKKTGPPIWLPQKILVPPPQTDAPPLLVKNDSSLSSMRTLCHMSSKSNLLLLVWQPNGLFFLGWTILIRVWEWMEGDIF